MKKLTALLSVAMLLTTACTPKASPAVTEATIPSGTSVSSDIAIIEAGQAIFSTKCTKCHKARPIEKWTYEEIRPTLASMVRKAKLTDTEITQVSAYVYANTKK